MAMFNHASRLSLAALVAVAASCGGSRYPDTPGGAPAPSRIDRQPYVISAEELTAMADRIASRNFRTFEVYFIVTLMYLAFSLFFELASTALQKVLFRWPVRT